MKISPYVWQDVYHSKWNGIPIYIKFQRAYEYFIISFKEM
ncbi:MAG: type II toxin-antitoxin system MqsR family toxin [Desulfamplus sp.]|nr:type II toxin-antitoxin system MqsR family toxin [Desulfamplus sp.]